MIRISARDQPYQGLALLQRQPACEEPVSFRPVHDPEQDGSVARERFLRIEVPPGSPRRRPLGLLPPLKRPEIPGQDLRRLPAPDPLQGVLLWLDVVPGQ